MDPTSKKISQLSQAKSFILHVLPGLLTTIAFILFKQVSDGSKYPPLLAFLLAVLFVDIPVQLFIMLLEGKNLNGRLSLKGVIGFREKLNWKSFILIFFLTFIIVYILVMLITPINNWLSVNVFSGLPAWFFLEEQSQYYAFSKPVLIAIFILQLLLTGIVLPIVEELYFRGFLLPRMSKIGWWAPLLSGLFFAFYHLWQPFGFLTVFLLGVVLAYITWWKKDIRLSICLHTLANISARIMFLLAALAM